MRATYSDMLRTVVHDYISNINLSAPPAASQVEEDLSVEIARHVDLHNATIPRGCAGRWPTTCVPLPPIVLAEVISAIHPIACIDTTGECIDDESCILALYNSTGKNAGLYVENPTEIDALIRTYSYNATIRDLAEIKSMMREFAPRVTLTSDPDLIAVNNGIFNYKTKTLMPFSPDYIFMAKSFVDYNDAATNVVIHNDEDGTDWDVESWMSDLSDDPEIVETLWEVIGAIVRPNVSWDKAAWFYSETGNNGKGTLCSLMRNLAGANSCASIPLANMGKDFELEKLLHSTSIVVDENDVGTFIDKAANLKALITHDIIQINRKFKTPVSYRFRGFMVQCLNEMPRARDKSDSFFRRQLFIPFTKCFTGAERRYIKDDYLKRKEILEYVMFRVLNMNYYKLSTPKACAEALNEYKEFNDPVRQFVTDVVDNCTWDLLPYTFLYELYRKWFNENMPSGTIVGNKVFIKDLLNAINTKGTWRESGQVRTSSFHFGYEPMIEQYGLSKWENKHFSAGAATIQQRCTPDPKQFPDRVRGIVRVTAIAANAGMTDEQNEKQAS